MPADGPAPADRYRCSDAGRDRHEPLFATGSIVPAWLLVEVQGSWGHTAVHDSALGEHVPSGWLDAMKARGIRVMCIRSHARRGRDDITLFTGTARRPGGPARRLWRRTVASLGDVATVAAELTVGEDPPPPWTPLDRAVFMVCTNGRHDQCCANRGRPLVRALRASAWADRVWESSHVGGDRFAPNLVALPDSVYFGRVEPDEGTAILAAFDDGRLTLDRFRGRTTFSLAEQAVEHYVRAHTGDDGADSVRMVGRDQDRRWLARVGDRIYAVRIRQRMVAVAEPLTCQGPPDRRTPEFTLRSIEEVTSTVAVDR
ncbi:MAG: sucrase ferredoxin [Acidimicrobiales bacterium]